MKEPNSQCASVVGRNEHKISENGKEVSDVCETSREQTLTPTPFPKQPSRILAVDFKCDGQEYLVIVDYFSRYIEVCPMSKTRPQLKYSM